MENMFQQIKQKAVDANVIITIDFTPVGELTVVIKDKYTIRAFQSSWDNSIMCNINSICADIIEINKKREIMINNRLKKMDKNIFPDNLFEKG